MSFGQGDPFGPGGSTPDWAALAEESERRHARKRRRLMIGGSALATVAIAGIVAVAVVSQRGGTPSDGPTQALPTPADLSADPTQPQPSFEEKVPPAPPRDYLKSPKKDTAPISTDTLFPDATVTVDGREYTREATDSTKDCASSAQGGLGAVLEKNGCRQLFRATYLRDGLAFTLGIAVFESESDAAAVKSGYEPNVASLSGGDVPEYCRTVVCRTTVNALGRYAFFTIAGHTDGEPAGDSDQAAKQTALDGSSFGYDRLIDRGRRQAEADARRS